MRYVITGENARRPSNVTFYYTAIPGVAFVTTKRNDAYTYKDRKAAEQKRDALNAACNGFHWSVTSEA